MTNEQIAAELGRFIDTHEALIVVINWLDSDDVKMVHLRDANYVHFATEPFFIYDFSLRKDEYLRIVAERLIMTYAKARYLK